MRIIDTKLNVIGLGSDNNKETVGIVFKTSEELDNRPLLGLIIPKFMIGYEFKDGDKASDTEIPISGSKCVNENSDKTLKKLFILNLYKIIPCLNSLNNSKCLYEKIIHLFKKESLISILK